MKIFIGCSSMDKIDKKYILLIDEVLKILKNYDVQIIAGGLSINGSMMYEVYDNFKDKIHIYTLPKYKYEIINLKASEYDLVSNTFNRTEKIYECADIFLMLPSGTGVLAEMFSILEEIRTNENNKKLIIFNYDDYYSEILKLINRYIDDGFANKNIKDKFEVINSLDDLKKVMEEY